MGRSAEHSYPRASLVLVMACCASVGPPADLDGQEIPGWHALPAPTADGFRYEDLWFTTSETGWVVGFGAVLRTTDGGESWEKQPFPGRWARSVTFASATKGWIGTLDPEAVLFETDDGGRTWQPVGAKVTNGHPEGVCGLWAVNDSLIYGVGRYDGPAHFMRSVDGGATWRVTDMRDYAARLVDVYFSNARSGIVVGGSALGLESRSVILRTTDAGESWKVAYTGSEPGAWAWKISFPDADTGYVSVESAGRAQLLRTVDGGSTWSEVTVPRGSKLQGVGFVTGDLGWTGEFTRTWVTADGGATWNSMDDPQALNRIRTTEDGVTYGAGARVYVLKRPRIETSGSYKQVLIPNQVGPEYGLRR